MLGFSIWLSVALRLEMYSAPQDWLCSETLTTENGLCVTLAAGILYSEDPDIYSRKTMNFLDESENFLNLAEVEFEKAENVLVLGCSVSLEL